MTVQEALSDLVPVKSQSYVMHKINDGKLSVLDNELYEGQSTEKVKLMVAAAREQHKNAKNDPEYWHTLGKLTYWQMVEIIVLAAELNEGELPDIPKPKIHNVLVMDAIANMQQYGIKVHNETINLMSFKKHGGKL